MQPGEFLSVGDVATRSGLAASAVRYYESLNLITATRTAGGRRRFTRDVLRRLAFIRAARNVGLTLDEIRKELGELPLGRTPTLGDWTRVAARWRSRLNAQIEALEVLRDRLDSCIGCGCLSLETCRISNPGDVEGRGGPGARLLPALLRRDDGEA